MNETARMITAALAAAVSFLLLFLVLHWNLLVCILLAVGVYFGLFLFLKPSRKIAGIDVETMEGGEELKKLLDDAKIDLADMARAIREIQYPAVQKDAGTLHQTGQGILNYLQENPDKIKLARRFFTYYLDTAARLLNRYVEFQNTGLRSGEVTEILVRTGEALPVLNRAFERQFTRLMEGELMDVEADIELLKSTLKMEGGQ